MMRALVFWIFAFSLAACSAPDSTQPPQANARQMPELQSPPECTGTLLKRAAPNYPPDYRPQAGFLVATFDLEGTGQATSVAIVDSTFPKSTNQAVLDMLARSQFRQGVHAKGCSFAIEVRERRL